MGIKANIGKAAAQMMPTVAPGPTSGMLRKLLQLAIDGVAKFPGARVSAGRYLLKTNGDVEAAIRALIKQHVMLAGAQGFATNIGGVVTTTASFPANMAGLATIQARMVAAIAHLRGYDLNDPRVRSAILMCLLGESNVKELIAENKLPTTPQAVATAPLVDPALLDITGQLLLGNLVTQVGGKRVVTVTIKRIPILGGGVGAVTDTWETTGIGSYARKQFVSRRHAQIADPVLDEPEPDDA